MSQTLTPHGPGFSFIDSFTVKEEGRVGMGRKWLDPTSPFFADHFPGEPLLPGVLLLEAAAQTAGCLWKSLNPSSSTAKFYLAQTQNFRWQQAVFPDVTLTVTVELEKDFGTLAQFKTIITVGEKTVASGLITLSQELQR